MTFLCIRYAACLVLLVACHISTQTSTSAVTPPPSPTQRIQERPNVHKLAPTRKNPTKPTAPIRPVSSPSNRYPTASLVNATSLTKKKSKKLNGGAIIAIIVVVVVCVGGPILACLCMFGAMKSLCACIADGFENKISPSIDLPNDKIERARSVCQHQLQTMNAAGMRANGNTHYGTGWSCHVCGGLHGSSEPFSRCLTCGFDYCSKCTSAHNRQGHVEMTGDMQHNRRTPPGPAPVGYVQAGVASADYTPVSYAPTPAGGYMHVGYVPVAAEGALAPVGYAPVNYAPAIGYAPVGYAPAGYAPASLDHAPARSVAAEKPAVAWGSS